jgi:hypothetical protein
MELLAYNPMNSTEHLQRRANDMKRLMTWPLLCGLLGLALAPASLAADAIYENDAIINYPGNVAYPPVIDAVNFVNTGTFTIDFTTISSGSPLYQTSDTVNYTNTGTMSANTGFNFDTLSTVTGFHTMAGSFNNPGTINCSYINDLGVLYYYDSLVYYESFYGYGIFKASATNIVNSGTVNVGVDGLMKFTGQNVDLRRSKLTMAGDSAGANITGSGIFGLNTNAWDPGDDLWVNYAYSAYFPMTPFYLELTNSTAYIQIDAGVSNNIIRAVFIQDTSGPNISYNVYFDTADIGFGNGNVTIEWVGAYGDTASGNSLNNYLYLNDDYMQSVATNVALFNGIPDNFTFTESNTRLNLGVPPTAAGFEDIFPVGSITNRYAFASAQLLSTTESTNAVSNPTHSITNLPGRIQISADQELNLAFADITGPNYLSVRSTNQFNGSAGAMIKAPYADFNLGVTNGSMTVSNLFEPSIPNWSGTVQAWSTRWLAVDPVTGATNDYRVLIVGSQLSPTTLAQVQDLILHSTTNLVISDTFNIMRTFNADAQNLTLTTNLTGAGATSTDGELNLGSSSIFWQNSLPYLRNLTNNGAIRLLNQANFGPSTVANVTPSIPAVAATGTLKEYKGTNVVSGNKLVIGTNQYVFYKKITNTIPNQILITNSFDGTLSNLIAAINHAGGAGYSTKTVANPFVTAGSLVSHGFTVSARTNGSAGNLITTTTTSTNLQWTGTTLSGGADAVAATTNTVSSPYNNFINNSLVSDQASIIYANNFVNGGTISNGVGAFRLQSLTTTLTNGLLDAGGDVSITASSLVTSNLVLHAGRSLTLQVTNLLTDTGVTNGNLWTVGAASIGAGFSLPVKPAVGDLLGTTITNIAPTNTEVINTWAGVDRGLSVSGYTNNVAVGRLILDVMPSAIPAAFAFTGTGTSNALYVDYLELRDYATNGGRNNNSFDFPWLNINTNLVIYYAQAMMNGISVAESIDRESRLSGANGGRLRWVYSYAGYYSSTNLVYPDGSTNTFNAALAASDDIDSNGNGIANVYDPEPFLVSSQVNFTCGLTNRPPLSVRLQWTAIPLATNYVYYRTNLLVGNWLPFTNFNYYYYDGNRSVPNTAPANSFVSPQPYQSPATNVWIFDAVTNVPHYYRVTVQPDLMYSN